MIKSCFKIWKRLHRIQYALSTIVLYALLITLIACESDRTSYPYYPLERYEVRIMQRDSIDGDFYHEVVVGYECPKCKDLIIAEQREVTEHDCGYTSFYYFGLYEHDKTIQKTGWNIAIYKTK